MERVTKLQKIHYLTEEDVRTAIFHWLHTVAGCAPNANEKQHVTAGSIGPVTITFTSDAPPTPRNTAEIMAGFDSAIAAIKAAP